MYVCCQWLIVCMQMRIFDRDGHIRHDSPIRHGEVERQEDVKVGDAAALVPVHHEYLPSILPL